MCETWTRDEWIANSKPASPDSDYDLQDTRYNQNGDQAFTFQESNGYWWAVLPGYGNYKHFVPASSWGCGATRNPRREALAYLDRNGFTLTEKPTLVSDVIADAEEALGGSVTSVSSDLVENRA